MKPKTLNIIAAIIGAALIIAFAAALVPLKLGRTAPIFSNNLPEWLKYLIF